MARDTSKLLLMDTVPKKYFANSIPLGINFHRLDFVSETLWPGEVRDERIIDITLTPDQPLASEELTARANTLRLQAAQGMATGLPPTAIINPNVTTVQPGAVYPTQPVSPIQPAAPSDGPVLPPWRPGQFLRNFFQPGGEPVQRIPETSGSYRPTIEQ